MNRSPDLLQALRAEIGAASLAELPAIAGALETLRLEIQVRLVSPAPVSPAEAPGNGDRLLSAGEVAERLGQKVDWVYSHKAELPRCTMPGRTIRFSEAGLKRWISRRRES